MILFILSNDESWYKNDLLFNYAKEGETKSVSRRLLRVASIPANIVNNAPKNEATADVLDSAFVFLLLV